MLSCPTNFFVLIILVSHFLIFIVVELFRTLVYIVIVAQELITFVCSIFPSMCNVTFRIITVNEPYSLTTCTRLVNTGNALTHIFKLSHQFISLL